MRAALFSLAILMNAGPALAAECADQTQSGLNACAGAAFKRADDALNKTYRVVVGRLKGDAEKTKLLVQAQKAWIGWRDSECRFSSSGVSGGSIYPLIYAQCLESQTIERTKALGAYLKCEEGDLACPAPSKAGE
jgi:uncharacterized protein YecT (DUF1311 family)